MPLSKININTSDNEESCLFLNRTICNITIAIHYWLAIRCCLSIHNRLLLPEYISLNIKVHEQNKEGDHQDALDVGELEGPFTLSRVPYVIQEESQFDEELSDLEPGEVLLPPQVLLHLGPEAGQEVVAVHEDVDVTVQCGSKHAVAARSKVGHDPSHHDHGTVVVDVKEC